MKKFIIVSYMFGMSSLILLSQNANDINNAAIASSKKTVAEETKIQTLPGKLILTSSDGKIAVTGLVIHEAKETSYAETEKYPYTFNIWNTSTGELIDSFEVPQHWGNLQLLPDNNTLLVHGSKDTLLLRFNQSL